MRKPCENSLSRRTSLNKFTPAQTRHIRKSPASLKNDQESESKKNPKKCRKSPKNQSKGLKKSKNAAVHQAHQVRALLRHLTPLLQNHKAAVNVTEVANKETVTVGNQVIVNQESVPVPVTRRRDNHQNTVDRDINENEMIEIGEIERETGRETEAKSTREDTTTDDRWNNDSIV